MNEPKAPTGFIGNSKTRDPLRKDWQTPPEILWPVRQYWGGQIPFDVCTSQDNPTGAAQFWTPEDDALRQSPWPTRFWMNSPYGGSLREWLEAAAIEAERGAEAIILASAARWEQGWLQQVLQAIDYIVFVRGRVAFVRPETKERVSGNTYATMYLAANILRPDDFVAAFSKVGVVVQVRVLVKPPEVTAAAFGRSIGIVTTPARRPKRGREDQIPEDAVATQVQPFVDLWG